MPVRTFPPAGSPGGEPLQAIIQLLAWMQEAEIWSPGISRATEEWMSRGDAESWEDFASATLSLAKRLPPSAFFELARRLESPGDWTGAAAWILRHPDRTEKFLDWVKASGSLGKVTVYLARHPNAPAWFQSLATTDASPIAALVSDGRPLGTGKLPAAWGIDFCARHSRTAVLIRWILLGAAAILGAAAVGRAGSSIEARNHHRMPFAVSSAIAGIFAAGFATMLAFVDDPTSEKSASPKYQIRLASPGAMAPSSTIAKNKVTMGTPTIVSLLIFGALQLAVYWAGRRKIREISDLDETPLIKLRLMENEENLFDAGLYVGMAGTAAALIFQVLGLFEANLLAAYASNLMGIVSVAVLKILSVRPFKEELILALDPSR